MQSDDEMNPPNWDRYYAQTTAIPGPEKVSLFLNAIPEGGRVLDHGVGSGRWTAAFMRDRPDLTVDILDQNVEKAILTPANWRGEKIASSFQNFIPKHRYDGIWSFASLFFLDPEALHKCFCTLATSLTDKGILFFSMVEDCDAARAMHLSGMQKSAIDAMLAENELHASTTKYSHTATYGANKMAIPTYFISARRLPPA